MNNGLSGFEKSILPMYENTSFAGLIIFLSVIYLIPRLNYHSAEIKSVYIYFNILRYSFQQNYVNIAQKILPFFLDIR